MSCFDATQVTQATQATHFTILLNVWIYFILDCRHIVVNRIYCIHDACRCMGNAMVKVLPVSYLRLKNPIIYNLSKEESYLK